MPSLVDYEFLPPSKPTILRGSLEKPISISEITDLIKSTLENNFQEVALIGEISNAKSHPSGHLYFSLKDEKACLAAVMFRGDYSKLKFKIGDGQRVIAIGRLSVYAPRGNYQIICTRLEPDGMGALQLAFEQLKKKLEIEGLFAVERKRLLPKFPRCVGIVTSASGAAIRDILQILERRFDSLQVLIHPVKVQGEGASEEIAMAIHQFNMYFPEVEVLIVGRGGGSIEDLWAFNEEAVARAIFSSRLPVISAVGHEVDFTIADFVADLRAPTPSAAAELVILSKLEVLSQVDHLSKRLLQVKKQVEFCSMRVDDFVQRLVHSLQQKISKKFLENEILKGRLQSHSPEKLFDSFRQRFLSFIQRLQKSPFLKLEKSRWKVDHLHSQLRLLSPKAIMDRGYSIVRILETGAVVKKAADVKMGDKLLIELSKGKITAKV